MVRLLMGAAAVLAFGAATQAAYRIPAERPIVLPSGDDADLVAAQCAACHSLDYVTTQPRGKGAQFWRDAVTKMKTVYGADIDKESADRIAAYLARNFG